MGRVIEVHVHHYHELSGPLVRRLDRIENLIRAVKAQGERMSQELDDLEKQVAETTSVEESAILLIQGLKQALDEAIASGDLGKVKILRDKLDGSEQALGAAVAANTPAAPGEGGEPTV